MSCTSKELALEDVGEAFQFLGDQIEGRGRHKDPFVQLVLDHFKIGDGRPEEAVLKYVKERVR